MINFSWNNSLSNKMDHTIHFILFITSDIYDGRARSFDYHEKLLVDRDFNALKLFYLFVTSRRKSQ